LPAGPTREEVQARLHELTAGWVAQGDWAREDGYIYAVDVAQLAVYAARCGDRAMFEPLRAALLERFMVEDGSDEARGFVAWRQKAGEPLDASGTTEALRAAEALWRGQQAFEGLAEDRATVLLILHGYARHGAYDQGQWLIRNYYNLRTQTYATNSYLIDYDPQFIDEVAGALDDEALCVLARRSAELVAQAVAPTGLLRQIAQPELRTLMPGGATVFFSPNNVEQLGNSAAVAERCVTTNRSVAEGVLRFAMQRWPRVSRYYDADRGRPVGEEPADAGAYAALLRLACRLDDGAACERLEAALLKEAEAFLNQPAGAKLYTAGEILLALEEARWRSGRGDGVARGEGR
jgi:hypothetical protein